MLEYFYFCQYLLGEIGNAVQISHKKYNTILEILKLFIFESKVYYGRNILFTNIFDEEKCSSVNNIIYIEMRVQQIDGCEVFLQQLSVIHDNLIHDNQYLL